MVLKPPSILSGGMFVAWTKRRHSTIAQFQYSTFSLSSSGNLVGGRELQKVGHHSWATLSRCVDFSCNFGEFPGLWASRQGRTDAFPRGGRAFQISMRLSLILDIVWTLTWISCRKCTEIWSSDFSYSWRFILEGCLLTSEYFWAIPEYALVCSALWYSWLHLVQSVFGTLGKTFPMWYVNACVVSRASYSSALEIGPSACLGIHAPGARWNVFAMTD